MEVAQFESYGSAVSRLPGEVERPTDFQWLSSTGKSPNVYTNETLCEILANQADTPFEVTLSTLEGGIR
jgi:hypothetical protein